MKILHVCPSWDRACGIANFAGDLAAELGRLGHEAQVHADFPSLGGDDEVVLIHHEWGILPEDLLFRWCLRTSKPVVLWPHTAEASDFSRAVAAFIVMHPGIVSRSGLSKLELFHPAHVGVPSQPTLRPARPRGIRRILGAHGFLLPHRRWTALLEALLPIVAENSWLAWLMAVPHMTTPDDELQRLAGLAEKYPKNLRWDRTHLSPSELNAQLSRCDVLWCYADVPQETATASGVASALWASGRPVVCTPQSPH